MTSTVCVWNLSSRFELYRMTTSSNAYHQHTLSLSMILKTQSKSSVNCYQIFNFVLHNKNFYLDTVIDLGEWYIRSWLKVNGGKFTKLTISLTCYQYVALNPKQISMALHHAPFGWGIDLFNCVVPFFLQIVLTLKQNEMLQNICLKTPLI